MPAGILTVIFRSLRHAARAAAGLARLGDDLPAPRHCGQVRATVKKPCWKRTCPWPRHCGQVVGDDPGAAPEPLARLAGFLPRNLDGRFGAARRFLERDLEVVAQIGAALRAAAAPAAAEQIAEAEHVAEDVAEDVAELGEDRRIEAAAGAGRGAHARVAEAVVQAALLGVGEHRVRLGALLELLFGGLVARIAIRVVLHRQLAVRALDLDVGRRARDAEDLVVVALAHAFATFTIAGRSSRSPIM